MKKTTKPILTYFIRLRLNTLQLVAGMKVEVNRAEAPERRRVISAIPFQHWNGYGAIPL